LALAAGRTGKTPSQTSAIASKPAPYHQGEALSAARFVGQVLQGAFGLDFLLLKSFQKILNPFLFL
jgi:hypothetical protein